MRLKSANSHVIRYQKINYVSTKNFVNHNKNSYLVEVVVVECEGDVGVGARTAGLVWAGQRAFRSSKLEARSSKLGRQGGGRRTGSAWG